MPDYIVVMKVKESNSHKPGMVVEVRPVATAVPSPTSEGTPFTGSETSAELLGAKAAKNFLVFRATLTVAQADRLLEPMHFRSWTVNPYSNGATELVVEDAEGFSDTPGVLGQKIRVKGPDAGNVERVQNLEIAPGGVNQSTRTLTLTGPVARNWVAGAEVLALESDGTLPVDRRRQRKYRRVRVANLLTAQELADVLDPLVDSPVMDFSAVPTSQWAARIVKHRDTPRDQVEGDL